MDEQPISRPKVTPAPLRPSTLLRERLVQRLLEGASRRLTLVVAEAGFGKTTLLADFSHRGLVRCLWYKLDASDRDWVSFLTYVVAAGREAAPEFAPRTHALLASATPEREETIASFLAELPDLLDERTVLILDDYQAVDDSSDVQEIVHRVLEAGPEGFGLIVVGRRQPPMRLGRLAAQDDLVELTTDDLRFSRDEIDSLFSAVYRQPLEGDIIDEIDSRTEGWAASLQLLHSSIRERSSSEIRTFVRRLSGAHGHLYDFLAEEVLLGLPPELARFMVRASLLERMVPEHVVPLFATDETPPSAEEAEAWIEAVADLGLAGKRSESSRSHRFHPLLREFLQRRLRETHERDDIREMHLRVARAAEADDWLTACRHYLDGGAAAEAMRVLDASALEAIGAGLWEQAAELVERQPDEQPDIVPSVILARREFASGHIEHSLARLRNLDLASAAPLARSLALHMRASASWQANDDRGLADALDQLLADPETPEAIRDIGEALRQLRAASRGGSLKNFSEFLVAILPRQRERGLSFFAATTLHNLCWLNLNSGEYRASVEYGEASLGERERLAVRPEEVAATLTSLAESSFELGLWNQGLDYLARARLQGAAQADAVAHAATLYASIGRTGLARELLDEAHDATAEQQGHPGGPLEAARAAVALGETPVGGPARHPVSNDVSAPSVSAFVMSASALISGSDALAAELARGGIEVAAAQGARHWIRRLRVLRTLATNDGNALTRYLSSSHVSEFLLLELAPLLARSLHLPKAVPDAVRRSVDRWPDRWLPELRRELTQGGQPSAVKAAELLDVFGTKDDVILLRAYERTYLRGARARGLGRALSRRTATQLYVHDLGRTKLHVGPRTVIGTDMRRRALALLLFLATRPGMTATREQVLESLWPDAEPASASNSLHQTLFFLRRDIDPWYDEDTSFNYVKNEADLVWIDDEMATVRSAQFAARLLALGGRTDIVSRKEVLDLYGGQFAPEFEYEDWAIAWRERLHAQYLAMSETQVQSQWEAGQLDAAVATAQQALSIDAEALRFEAALVALYAHLGSDAASARQYEHYAMRSREVFGTNAPPRQTLVALDPARLRTVY